MTNQKRETFRMEAAGSLTPALEGAPCSARHPRRTGAKRPGRGGTEKRDGRE